MDVVICYVRHITAEFFDMCLCLYMNANRWFRLRNMFVQYSMYQLVCC